LILGRCGPPAFLTGNPRSWTVDSGADEGCSVTPFYDPTIAKLIVHAPFPPFKQPGGLRQRADRWRSGRSAPFSRASADPDFIAGRVDTGFVERQTGCLLPADELSETVLQAATQVLRSRGPDGPWTALTGFRINATPDRRVMFELGQVTYAVSVNDAAVQATTAQIERQEVLFLNGEAGAFGLSAAGHASSGAAASDGAIVAPMPGKVIEVRVTEGPGSP
jgi:3-methylcrotonyl-CoA carboxylase alpha subunit